MLHCTLVNIYCSQVLKKILRANRLPLSWQTSRIAYDFRLISSLYKQFEIN